MKELSIEEKAKAYDIALDKIKMLLGTGSSFSREELEYVFPELKESEDERIKHEIKVILANTDLSQFALDYTFADMLEYLEKQGKQKSLDDVAKEITKNKKTAISFLKSCGIINANGELADEYKIKQGEQKLTDAKEYDFHGIKFIPKFAKGDIIKDKKRGEVSTIEGFSYDTGLYTHTYGQFPITIQDNYEIIAQKPAWSEEDEINLEKAIWYVENPAPMVVKDSMLVEWLKNIRGRVQPQPKVGWSEEDEKKLLCICAWIKDYPRIADFKDEMYTVANNYTDWLKSIKDRVQPHWKPSDEQMKALYDSIPENVFEISEREQLLESLYQDLKKL